LPQALETLAKAGSLQRLLTWLIRDQVCVQVKYYLSTASIHIYEYSITHIRNPELLSNFYRGLADMRQDMIVFRNIVQSRDMLAGHNENVYGSSGSDVPKRYHMLVRIDYVSGFLTLHDITE